MENKEIKTFYKEYESEAELNEKDKTLLLAAKNAAKHAYAPYSGFHVGAALLLESGTIFTGNNQENAAYPSGLCAERVAVFAAAAQNKGVAFNAIAIVGFSKNFEVNTPVTPCGSCRQVISEYEHLFNSPIKVILAGNSGKVLVFESAELLLPFSFKPENLNK